MPSKRRGKPGNNRISHDVHQRVVQLIRDRYSDFGPTLACEKLSELHDIHVSRETLRKWMRDAGLWKGKKRKVPKLFHLRARRPQFGELVQIDGCGGQRSALAVRGADCVPGAGELL
ncbi:MAG: hypothetical protein AAF471_02570 [Myxococcota bacterium]